MYVYVQIDPAILFRITKRRKNYTLLGSIFLIHYRFKILERKIIRKAAKTFHDPYLRGRTGQAKPFAGSDLPRVGNSPTSSYSALKEVVLRQKAEASSGDRGEALVRENVFLEKAVANT